jgi:DNA-binding NtrC family response regulator
MAKTRSETDLASPDGRVLVVASNLETLDSMRDYFNQTGITSSERKALNPLAELAGAVRALVIFPDDFPRHEASAYLSMVRTRRPDLPVVVVTREPNVYAAITATNGRPLAAVVLPRPAFGWAILDALRAALQTQAGA